MSNETEAIERIAISKNRGDEKLTIPDSAPTQGYIKTNLPENTISFANVSNGKPIRKLIRFEFSND